ncbi:hypothetical protein HGH93_28900 [Chitinophaga polysaccharea]|uniref:hypothetical protein n=1 Tax=Chitinophaga polysaccharea TaxID=1293035 RepID=UPI001455B0A4|nr:hypothetical protein [Chitinophaga polysaccharea]NLR62145.1 hypothetical protein [Chitinophaga polysaccharea]
MCYILSAFKPTPIPILFNPLKHHLAALQHTLLQSEPSEIRQKLLALGNSQMDMYAGELDTTTIFNEVRNWLQERRIYERTAYAAFLVRQQGYATVVLSDTSRWILRMAADQQLYIHLHPGRYSPHTFRVKATALKTALAYRVAERHRLLTGNLLQDLNALRKELQLSPLRSATESSHIMEIIDLLKRTGSEEI